jgi:hypothetical protein
MNIELLQEITSSEAYFKAGENDKGELHFEQPVLVGGAWNVEIWGFDVLGNQIPIQTIEIDVPQNEVPVNGFFKWGKIFKYIADKVKKKLCPVCT